MDSHDPSIDVQRDEAALLAAFRRAGCDPELALEEPPSAVNPRATVIAIRLRSATTPALNRPAMIRLCDSTTNAVRQAAIMRYLRSQGFPVAEVLLAGSPGDPLGGAWLLTERITTSRTDGPGVASALRTVWRRPDLLADLCARLHAIDPEPLQKELCHRGAGLDWYPFLWSRAHMVEGPGVDAVHEWLVRNRPTTGSAPVVTHGDLHHDNVVQGADGARVIDWEIAGLAPPARDIACTMVGMLTTYCRAPRPMRPVAAAAASALSRRFLRRYRAQCPVPLPDDELAWHRVLYSLSRLFWARMAPHENDPNDPAARHEYEARDHEFPIHVAIIKAITGVELSQLGLRSEVGA